MNNRLQQLQAKRNYLLERSAEQRVVLSQAAEPWRHTLAQADRVVAAVRYLQEHPIWLAGAGGLVLATVGPRRIVRWFGRGLYAWRLISQLKMQ